MEIIEPIKIGGNIEIEVTVRTSVGEGKRITTIGSGLLSLGDDMEEILAYQGAKMTKEAWRSIIFKHVTSMYPEKSVEDSDKLVRSTWHQMSWKHYTKEERAAMRRHENRWYRHLWRWLSKPTSWKGPR